jgi:hypothetical protein
MASQRQIEANRRNAQKSTGPKTEAGRARSRMNALTHGLSRKIPVSDPAPDPVPPLARAIAGEGVTAPDVLACAEQIAVESLLLRAIRRRREELLAWPPSPTSSVCPKVVYPRESGALAVGRAESHRQACGPRRNDAELCDVSDPRTGKHNPDGILRDLTRLERYERQATSRRSRALHRLEEAFCRPSSSPRREGTHEDKTNPMRLLHMLDLPHLQPFRACGLR